MSNLIIQISRYLIIILMALYTFQCFSVLRQKDEEDRNFIFLRQNVLMFFLHFVCFTVLYLEIDDIRVLYFYGAQAAYLLITLVLFRLIYPLASRLLINNMCMLITIGFVMITRISYDQSVRQFEIIAASTVIALIVPVLIRKLKTRYEVSFLWDKKGRHVLILGGQNLEAEFILASLREMIPAFPEINQTAVCIGEIVSGADRLSVSYQSACRVLNATDLHTDELIAQVCVQGGTIRQDAVFSRIDRIFHIQDSTERSLRVQEFLELLLSSADREEAYDLLRASLMQLFIQSFPEKREPRTRLENRLRMSSARSCDDWSDLIDFTYLLYQHTLNELSPVVHRAVSYIQENYARQISIKDYCQICKMSMPYFGHLFKTETGMFFNNYLTQCRMCAAIALMNDTEMKISDVAEACGFSSNSYFISCFKKQTGLSPVKFRALRRSAPPVL